jgi:uncharacterized protein YegP (UPF0339 family)
MSRSRASALLASIAVILSMTLGVSTFTATAASATHKVSYPAEPPKLVVNKGVVKYGVTVKATGSKFKAKEKITITVKFLPKGKNKYTVKTVTGYADKKGKFTYNVKTKKPGTIILTARGKTSKKSASASIYVIDKKKHGKRGFAMQPAAFTGGPTSTPQAGAPASDTASLALAGMAIAAMAGGAVVAVRRRRRAGIAA